MSDLTGLLGDVPFPPPKKEKLTTAEELLLEVLSIEEHWETLIPSEDWNIVPASEPLTKFSDEELAPPDEGPRPLWDGAIKIAPVKVSEFDPLFESEEYVAAQARAPLFRPLTGRFNPFEKFRMLNLLEGQHYSAFLMRPIITFRDACDHNIQISRIWAEEDENNELAAQAAEVEWVPPPKISDVKAERVEAARIAWKNAVAMRKEAMEKWDNYVSELRMRFQHEKTQR